MVDASTIKRGTNLEYLVASVFQGQGYLVRRSVPLKYGPSGQDATDIDVLGVKFTQPFQPHRIICDCRERQRARPYERIFWAKGLASFVNAAEIYVSLPRAAFEVIAFAKAGQVRVLTQEVLKDSLHKIYGADRHAYGLANGSFFEPFYNRILPLLRKEKEAANILFQAQTLYLVDDPYVSANICLSCLAICADKLRRVEGNSPEICDLWRFIAADLTVLTSLLLLYMASDTIGLSKVEREHYIVERLTYGDISPRKAEEIFSSAKDLAIEAVKTLIPTTSREALRPFDIGLIEAPSYAKDISGLVERAIASPSLYHELPQLIDFLLFEQSLQNRGFSDDEYRNTFPNQTQDERLKVARNIFSFLRDAVGFELKAFWPNQENNLPRGNPS